MSLRPRAKKPGRQNGINDWKRLVGKNKRPRKQPLQDLAPGEKHFWALFFSCRQMEDEKVSPARIAALMKRLTGRNPWERMPRYAKKDMREFMREHNIRDFTK